MGSRDNWRKFTSLICQCLSRLQCFNTSLSITKLGELIVLPLVVLVTIMAQPRLTHTMANDGVLPSIFAEVDDKGNLKAGLKIAGAVMISIGKKI